MAKKPQPADARIASWTVESPVRHNGAAYGVGEQVEMTDAEAAPLVALGALKASASAEADKQPAG